MSENPDCDGGRCTFSAGEVRMLPLGANKNHGNLVLCRTCHAHEISFRRARNRELAAEAWFDLPAWETLEVYKGAP